MKQGGDTDTFSRWRVALWPVHGFELKKLLPMLAIFFLISFDYNILRVMKDTLVVAGGKNAGAEAIPFIKVWVMFPCALFMTALFSAISNHAARERVFYWILGVFLVFFLFFALFLFPNREALHPHQFADRLEETLPAGFHGLVLMLRNWTFTLFYAMSELWSNIILSLTFWGFANSVTRLSEAKRFYGLFGIGANFSGVVAGMISANVCSLGFNPAIPFGGDAWEQSFFILLIFVLIAGIAAIALFRWFHKSVLSDSRFCNAEEQQEAQIPAGKNMSVKENINHVLRSPYLLCIAFIVLSYNIVINLVEVVWKQQVRELYPSPSDYQIYMSYVTTVIGVIATACSLFVSGNSIRKYGWKFTAMLTPVILLLTSIGFFFFFFLNGRLDTLTYAFFGLSPLALVVFFGSAQNVLSRAAKYTVFDATKEMAFVPLTPESKLKGKAAIDGIVSRMGKSGGSLIHQAFLLTFVTINASAPYVAIVLFGVIAVWSGATYALGNMFQLQEKKLQTAPAPALEDEIEPSIA